MFKLLKNKTKQKSKRRYKQIKIWIFKLKYGQTTAWSMRQNVMTACL